MPSKLLLSTTIAMAFLLTACGGSDNDSREAQIEAMARQHGIEADVTLDEDGEVSSAVIIGAGGTQVGKNLQLPDGFPEDVSIPSDWVVIASSPTPGGFMLSAMTKTTAEEALAASREKLTADGWNETGFAQPNPMMIQVGFSKANRMTNLNLMDTGDGRNIQLVTMEQPK